MKTLNEFLQIKHIIPYNFPFGEEIEPNDFDKLQENNYIYCAWDENHRYIVILNNPIKKPDHGNQYNVNIKIGLNAADEVRVNCAVMGFMEKDDVVRYCNKEECEQLDKLAKEHGVKL